MGTDIPIIHTWEGVPLTDLSQEKLIEIISILATQLEEERRAHLDESTAHMISLAKMAMARRR